MVVGGGGGGGEDQPGNRGGGGGAGGYRTNVPTSLAPPLHNTTKPFPVDVKPLSCRVGAGANPPGAEADYGGNGSDSSFGPPSAPARISTGGGGGGETSQVVTLKALVDQVDLVVAVVHQLILQMHILAVQQPW